MAIPVRYWRDKAGSEVDFVMERNRDEVDAFECKWNPASFNAKSLKTFRSYYPNGRNYLVSPSAVQPYERRYGDLVVRVCTPTEFKAS